MPIRILHRQAIAGEMRRPGSRSEYQSASRFGPYPPLAFPISKPSIYTESTLASTPRPMSTMPASADIARELIGLSFLHADRRSLKRVRGCILLACHLAQDGAGIAPLPAMKARSPAAAELTDRLQSRLRGFLFPHARASERCDAVRFSVARDSVQKSRFVLPRERAHLPVAHGNTGLTTWDPPLDLRSSRRTHSEDGRMLPGFVLVAPNTEWRYFNPSTSE